MSSVRFSHVSKRFGDTIAVDDLTLDIEDQEFMVLLGPSGCGKTTALRMIAGLEGVSSGTLSIGDTVVNDIPASERDIAMVFQSYALYPHMSVRSNIASPLVASKSRRLEPNERSQRIAEAAQILGLTEYLDRKPGELSGGQRQRVALARAIVRRPDVFLMDEPLSNLDAKLRTQTRAELVDLHRRLSTTFVYVTHDQVEAMTMATRVAIIADGKLHQAGTPEEVYARPANLFVATFIGSPPMNVLNGVLHETDGVRSVVTEAGTIAISGSAPAESSEPGSPSGGRGVAAAVRPEHLSVDPSGTLDATVASVEHLGHEVHVLVKIGSEMVVIRQSTSAPRVAPGSSTRVRVDPQEVHLFDPSSGERVS